jgi:branched-chain amino acid transport system substrate-binding protein
MNRPARLRWTPLALVAVLSLLLAACGGAPAAPSATEAPAEPTAAAEAPTAAPAATESQPTAAATEAPAATGAAGAAEGEEIVVGMMTDASGLLAIYGPMLERGFELGLEYATDGSNAVAGRPIRVVVKDTASNPETGVSLAREAIESDGASVLVGSPSSPVALAVAGVAAENEVLYIAAPAATPALTAENFSPYVFRAGRTSGQDALTMGAALLEQGTKFVQIAQDNAFGRGSAGAFYATVKGLGGEFVLGDTADEAGTVFAPPETTDFTPYINQILDSGAEVLIVTWSGTGFVPMFQQMQQLGVFDAMTVATGFGDNQTMAQGYADAEGSVGVSVYHYSLYDNEVNSWFVEQHQARYNTPPDLFTESGFNAAVMLVRALEATGGDPAADGLSAALEGMSFEGPKGTYTIRAEDHVLLQPMTLVKLIDTAAPDFMFFELVKKYEPEQTAPPCAVPAEVGRCK